MERQRQRHTIWIMPLCQRTACLGMAGLGTIVGSTTDGWPVGAPT
jgi:hypothetical protein